MLVNITAEETPKKHTREKEKEKERSISLRKFLDEGFLFCVTGIFNTPYSWE